MNWLKKNPTDQDREDAYNEVIDGRRELYRIMAEENKNYMDIFRKLYRLEFEGGTCWTCGLAWKRKEINNEYLRGYYFVPQCDCFVTCPACDTPLYDLQYKYRNQLKFCDNCGFQLYNPVTKTQRHGKAYKKYFDNLSEREKRKAINERFH